METIQFGDYAQPACLAFEDDADLYKPGTKAVLSGWGNNVRDPGAKGPIYSFPNFLQAATLDVLDVKTCNDTYHSKEAIVQLFFSE